MSSSGDTPGRNTEGGVRRCPSLGFFTPQAVTPYAPRVHDQAPWMLGSSEELDFPLFHYAKEEVARQMFWVLSGQYMNLTEEGQQEYKRGTSLSLADSGFLEGVKLQMARWGRMEAGLGGVILTP